MEKFLRNFFIFIFVIAALSYSTDKIISIGLRKTDLRKYQVWNDIYSLNINSDVVIMGSSRAWTQYSTKILDSIDHVNSYNLGIDGNPINYQIIRYNTYRRFNKKPKYIIQNIDFSTLAIRKDGYEREQYFPFVFDDTLMSLVGDDKKLNWLYRKIPLIRYFGYRDEIEEGIESFFGKKFFFDGNMYKGYRGNDYSWDGSKLKKIDKALYAKDPKAVTMFDNYLAQCKTENIKVILVSAPVYIEATKKIIDEKSMKTMYLNFAHKYNFKLLDYTNDSLCYDKSNFYNATHLNKKGSELFSIKLANDLRNYVQQKHFY